MERPYEGMLIFDCGLKKEDMDSLIAELESDIGKNGKVVEVQRIGRRKLEHAIGGKPEGYFVQINFHVDSQALGKITAKLRLKEAVLRSFFVQRPEGFVKFKSFDENAPSNDGHYYNQGYAQDAPAARQGGY